MSKLKTALLCAQEIDYQSYASNYHMLQTARACLADALNCSHPDEGLASAERALALLNAYLREV